MNEEKYIKVTDGQKKERIDKFLCHQLENLSRTKIQDLIDSGNVHVNSRLVKPSYIISPDDSIKIVIFKKDHPPSNQAENIRLNILYEDDFLLIVNKPAGMVTHPAHGNYTGTLVNALLYHTQSLSGLNNDQRPGIVHRIDKGTSGLLVVAKNDFVHNALAIQFHDHSVEREYRAIVWGRFSTKRSQNKSGTIQTFLGRSKKDRKRIAVLQTGKNAITSYEVLEEFNNFSYVRLILRTGRTHQIRVHLSYINHPVLGDPEYGGRKIVYGEPTAKNKAFINNLLELTPYQLLHAKTIGFVHPVTKKVIRFESELPDYFQLILSKLKASN